MKVLLINDFIECGGAELQTKREMSNFISHNDEVLLITFDKKNKIIENNINIKINYTFFSKVYNKLFSNPIIKFKLKRIIKKFGPDYIHINNIFACPITVYKAVKNYKTVQTIRDYGAVCSKTTCIYDDYTECAGYCNSNCKNCLKNKGFKTKFKKKSFDRINKFKFKSIDKFICPSEALTMKCKENNHDIVCINNPFDFSKITVKEKKLIGKKIFLYYGMIEEIKGIYILIDAFKKFYVNKDDVELHIIGKVVPKEKELFEKSIENDGQIKYFGYMKNDLILNKLKEVFCVVVPSLWIENYPNTVLEPMANKTIVIGSNRGGIKGMINNEDLLFDIKDSNDLLNKLEYVYSLDTDTYMKFVEDNFKKIETNNTIDVYYERLTNLLKSL